MKIFYIDESGYTGPDLLNKDQLFQGLSAISLNKPDDANMLIQKYWGKFQGKELKYKNIFRNQNNHNKILECLQEIIENHSTQCLVYHKKFMLILKMLDVCLEPYFYEKDMNFYEKNLNRAIANTLFFTGNQLSNDNFNKLLAAFQSVIRKKNDTEINNFLSIMSCMIPTKLNIFFKEIFKYPNLLISELKSEGNMSDVSDSLLIAMINILENNSKENYEVFHDESKNLLTHLTKIEKLLNIKESKNFKLSYQHSWSFPLKIKKISMGNSINNPALQLSDILIGSVIDGIKAKFNLIEMNIYNSKILSILNNNFYHLFPDKNFTENKENLISGEEQNFINYIGKKLS